MPVQKPHRSKQDYVTPPEFISAVHHLLTIEDFTFDFAADPQNAKAPNYWAEREDSLSKSALQWNAELKLAQYGWGWLNPPFTNIGAWAAKCAAASAQRSQTHIAMLVPAGVGSNWFRDYVAGKAEVLFLNGRLCFIPEWRYTVDPSPRNTTGAFYQSVPLYPKDCILCLYGHAPGYKVWTWKDYV